MVLTRVLKEDIFWFEVSVTDSLFMQMFCCSQHLLNDVGCGFLFDLAMVFQLFEQISTLAHLRHKVNEIFIKIYFVEINNIRVIEFHKYIYFSL